MASGNSGAGAQLSWTQVAIRSAGVVAGGALVLATVTRADLDSGTVSLAQLQLIGDADHVPDNDIVAADVLGAYWWDLLLVVGYTLLLAAAADLACRGYRLRFMRSTARHACLAAVVGAAALDLLETTLMRWQLQDRPVAGRLDALVWPVIAAANWAKILALFVVFVVVVGGIASYVSTPRWLRTAIARSEVPAQDDSASLQGHEHGGERERSALGIALSGGGVRSASISLGALQDLEYDGGDLGWDRASHVTAVSGGAYMAGAFQVARNRPPGRHRPAAEPNAWRRNGSGVLSPEERHLLSNLGYLTAREPRGHTTQDVFGEERTPSGNTRAGYHRASAVATLVAGLLANVIVLWAALGVLILPYGWLMQWLEVPNLEDAGQALRVLVRRQNIVQPGLIWLGLGLVLTLAWVLVSKVPRLRKSRALLGALEGGSRIGLGLGLFFLGAFVALPWLSGHLPTSGQGLLSALVAAAAALSAQARLLIKPAARFANKIGGVAFLVMLVIVVALWTRVAFEQAPDLQRVVSVHPQLSTPLVSWLLLVGFLVATWFAVSPESWSLSAFYRGRLRMAYATYRTSPEHATCMVNDSDQDVDHGRYREPALKSYAVRVAPGRTDEPELTTPLTICAASTTTTRAVRTHYGIPALSVTFSPDKVRVFVPEDGRDAFTTLECSTEAMHAAYDSKWWKPRGRLTTMFAVAISGAAVSPAMGRFRIGPTSMLLTFANVRLGVWLPNPRYVDQVTWRRGRSFPKARLGYLFKEFFGIHDPTDAFLYVTDGGHWENTGLVELLRLSDYREIVCIDADQGPADRVKALAQAVDLAKLECDVDVNIDLDALRASRDAGGGPSYAARSVTLGLVHTRDHTGVLWYAKPALTRDMPTQLLAHREVRQDFPRASTLNQFFDTSTFFAYRDLGRYNAWQIRRARKQLRQVLADHPTYEGFRQAMERTEATEANWAGCQLHDCLRREPRERRDTGYQEVRAALGVDTAAPPAPRPSYDDVEEGLEAKQDAHELAGQG